MKILRIGQRLIFGKISTILWSFATNKHELIFCGLKIFKIEAKLISAEISTILCEFCHKQAQINFNNSMGIED